MIALFGLTAAALVGWHYLGYPLAVGLLYRRRSPGQAAAASGFRPSIAVVVTVHNEAEAIVDRIANICRCGYPREKLEIVVASDGSTDETVALVETNYPAVTVVDCPERNKAATRARGVDRTDADVLVFTDASTRFRPDCLDELVRQFADPDVGVVSGRLTSADLADGVIGTSMRRYWAWEYSLRRAHGAFGLLPKLSGAILAVRRPCYAQQSPHVDVDQTAGLVAMQQGYAVRQADTAVATERFRTNPADQFHARRRLTVQACTTLWQYRDVLDPTERPGLFLSTVSYWQLRYFVPWLLLVVFAASLPLGPANPVTAALFLGGSTVVAAATIGALGHRIGATLQPFSLAFAFLWVNAGILVGTVEFVLGRRVNSYDR